MKKIFLVLCVAVGIGVFGHAEKSAAEALTPVSLEVFCGFDGLVKYGHAFPIKAVIKNDGNDFEGTLKLVFPHEKSSSTYNGSWLAAPELAAKNYQLEAPVSVKFGKTQELVITVPYLLDTGKFRAVLLNKEGKEIVNNEITLKGSYSNSVVYIGVLGENSKDFQVFDGVGLYEFVDMSTKLIRFESRDIQENPFFFDSMDLFIISDNTIGELSLKQKDAIMSWVMRGGVLVFDSSVSSELVREFVGEDLFKEETVGNGIIKTAEFNKLIEMLENHKNYELKSSLDQVLVECMGIDRLENSYYLSGTANFWEVSNLTNTVAMDRIPNIWQYAGVLAVYVVLTGPVLYIVLKKLDKRHRIQSWIVFFSISFSVIIFILGGKTRFQKPFINYAAMTTIDNGRIDELVNINIQSPSNAGFTMSVEENYQLMPLNENGYWNPDKEVNWEQFNIGVSFTDNQTKVTIQDLPAFTQEYFRLRRNHISEDNKHIAGEVTFFGGKMFGTLTNNLGMDLENAAIVFYNHIVFLDDFKAGEVKRLNDLKVYLFASDYSYMAIKKMVGTEPARLKNPDKEYIQAAQKEMIVNSYMNQQYSSYNESSFLIGFCSEKDNVAFQMDENYESYGIEMITVPVEINYRRYGRRYYPFVSSTAMLEKGNFSDYSNSVNSEETIIEYSVLSNLENMDLYITQEEYYNEYYEPFHGTMLFYNWDKEVYEQIEKKKTKIDAEDFQNYLSEENKFKVKYLTKLNEEYSQGQKLPRFSVIGGDIDAEN